MIRLSITNPFEGEFHFDTAQEVVELFAAFSAQGMSLNSEVKRKSNAPKSTDLDTPEEIARRKAVHAQFNPKPGMSYLARAERALRSIGRPSSPQAILSKMLEEDPAFALDAKTPIVTLRQVLGKSKSGVFKKNADKFWELTEWLK